MLAPKKWLNDYLDREIDTDEFVKKMIMTGNAVESVTELGEEIHNVVVGRILSLAKHPDADKLQICMIDVGEDEPVQIVTGADNVAVGDLIPVAKDGAKLPTGLKIKASKLRGVPSAGMLCSGEELKLTEEDYPGAGVYGILILKEDHPVGMDIKQALSLSDTVFEFEVGANRPDCLSLMGIAKETAAACGVSVVLPGLSFGEAGGDISDYVRVKVEDTDLCPRYMARVIKNVKIAPSPKWMQQRLISAGVRPINNIVDITNFVMIEMGQPMHAFDLSDISGGQIVVRRAHEGERMTTLDEKERELTSSMLMICDGEAPIGIAGVMGGLDSEIKEDTSTVVFEAAKFAYGNIRQTSRALGLSTEASMRFSKGIDAANTADALHRALHLVEQLGAGEIVAGEIDILSCDTAPVTVVSEAARINALLGADIPVETMAESLNRLGLYTEVADGKLKTTVPGLRSDITGTADIAEEVARIYGYDNIPVNVMRGELISGRVSSGEKLRDSLKAYMAGEGFYECLTYSFVSPQINDKLNLPEDDALMRTMIKIENPLGEDKSVMRTSPVGDLLNVVALNLSRNSERVRVFEVGTVYLPASLPLTDLPEQRQYLCAATNTDGFLELKSVVEKLCWKLNLPEVTYTAGGRDWFHPGRRALLTCGKTEIGVMGEAHPAVCENFGIDGRVTVFWLYLDEIARLMDGRRSFAPLPKYPAITRDLAFVLDREVTSEEVRRLIAAQGGKYLREVKLFDVYEGKNLPAKKKSLAFSMTFRAADRTLTDSDIAKSMDKIVAAAESVLGATIRK